MLATPSLQRQPTLEFLMSVMKTVHLCAQHGHTVDSAFVGGDCFISKARNGLVQSFIESWKTDYPAEVLVFIDDDQSWDEQAFLRIIHDPHEFIGVAIPKKMDSDPQVFNNVSLDTSDTGNCYVENGLLRGTQIGSGFIALKRSCIEKMIAAYPARYAPGDGGAHQLHYNLFESKIFWDAKDPTITGQFWGEDLNFCKLWCALGEKIWVDPNVTVEHIGRKSWTGNFMHYLQKFAAVEVTAPFVDKPIEAIPETLSTLEKMAA
jgi:hypothetical protein